jgi:hypothetical protein
VAAKEVDAAAAMSMRNGWCVCRVKEAEKYRNPSFPELEVVTNLARHPPRHLSHVLSLDLARQEAQSSLSSILLATYLTSSCSTWLVSSGRHIAREPLEAELCLSSLSSPSLADKPSGRHIESTTLSARTVARFLLEYLTTLSRLPSAT